MFSNRLIGGVRIRQLRVAPNRGCQAPNQLKEVSHGLCYDYEYSDKSRDTQPFGPADDPQKYDYPLFSLISQLHTLRFLRASLKIKSYGRYKFQTSDQTGSAGILGYILTYLDGGGYVVDVNMYLSLNLLLPQDLIILKLSRYHSNTANVLTRKRGHKIGNFYRLFLVRKKRTCFFFPLLFCSPSATLSVSYKMFYTQQNEPE
jgi:hypothetical protein